MAHAVESAFEVAFWYDDTALKYNEYLQPQKLQKLLFLSQAYFAVAFGGAKLMPAVFVAEELGPVEPTIYKAFSKGKPDIDVDLFLSQGVEAFLAGIWRRFGNQSSERLTKLTRECEAYRRAYGKGRRTEITLEAMHLSFARARETPGLDQVIKPQVMRTQTGRPVAVKAWTPKRRPAAPPTQLAADPWASIVRAARKD